VMVLASAILWLFGAELDLNDTSDYTSDYALLFSWLR
jgi:hypothetical protein